MLFLSTQRFQYTFSIEYSYENTCLPENGPLLQQPTSHIPLNRYMYNPMAHLYNVMKIAFTSVLYE